MRPHTILLSLALFHFLLGSTVARGESLLEAPKRRQGYYIGVGQLATVSQNWDRGDALGVGFGRVTSIRMGELLTHRFGLGLQLDLGMLRAPHVESTLFDLGVEAHFEVARNLVAYGGVGLGVVSVKDDRDQEAGLRGAFGTAYCVGASYDWFLGKGRLTGGWALSPRLLARFIPSGDIKSFATLLGLEISYWTGLPRHQLELPEKDAYKK